MLSTQNKETRVLLENLSADVKKLQHAVQMNYEEALACVNAETDAHAIDDYMADGYTWREIYDGLRCSFDYLVDEINRFVGDVLKIEALDEYDVDITSDGLDITYWHGDVCISTKNDATWSEYNTTLERIYTDIEWTLDK